MLKLLTIFLSFFAASARDYVAKPSENNTILTCDQCKTLVGLAETVDICLLFPVEFRDECEAVLPTLIDIYTPEVICEKIGDCQHIRWWHLLSG